MSIKYGGLSFDEYSGRRISLFFVMQNLTQLFQLVRVCGKLEETVKISLWRVDVWLLYLFSDSNYSKIPNSSFFNFSLTKNLCDTTQVLLI